MNLTLKFLIHLLFTAVLLPSCTGGKGSEENAPVTPVDVTKVEVPGAENGPGSDGENTERELGLNEVAKKCLPPESSVKQLLEDEDETLVEFIHVLYMRPDSQDAKSLKQRAAKNQWHCD